MADTVHKDSSVLWGWPGFKAVTSSPGHSAMSPCSVGVLLLVCVCPSPGPRNPAAHTAAACLAVSPSRCPLDATCSLAGVALACSRPVGQQASHSLWPHFLPTLGSAKVVWEAPYLQAGNGRQTPTPSPHPSWER